MSQEEQLKTDLDDNIQINRKILERHQRKRCCEGETRHGNFEEIERETYNESECCAYEEILKDNQQPTETEEDLEVKMESHGSIIIQGERHEAMKISENYFDAQRFVDVTFEEVCIFCCFSKRRYLAKFLVLLLRKKRCIMILHKIILKSFQIFEK